MSRIFDTSFALKVFTAVPMPHGQQQTGMLRVLREQSIAQEPWLEPNRRLLIARHLGSSEVVTAYVRLGPELAQLVDGMLSMPDQRPESRKCPSLTPAAFVEGARLLMQQIPESETWPQAHKLGAIGIWHGHRLGSNSISSYRRREFYEAVRERDKDVSEFLGESQPRKLTEGSAVSVDSVVAATRHVLDGNGEEAWLWSRHERGAAVSRVLKIAPRVLVQYLRRYDALIDEIRTKDEEVADYLEKKQFPVYVRAFVAAANAIIKEWTLEPPDHKAALRMIADKAKLKAPPANPYRWARNLYLAYGKQIAVAEPDIITFVGRAQQREPDVSLKVFIARARDAMEKNLGYARGGIKFIGEGFHYGYVRVLRIYRENYEEIKKQDPEVAEFFGDPANFKRVRTEQEFAAAIRKVMDDPNYTGASYGEIMVALADELDYSATHGVEIRYAYLGFKDKLRNIDSEAVDFLEAAPKDNKVRRKMQERSNRFIKTGREVMGSGTYDAASFSTKLQAIAKRMKISMRYLRRLYQMSHTRAYIQDKDPELVKWLGEPAPYAGSNKRTPEEFVRMVRRVMKAGTHDNASFSAKLEAVGKEYGLKSPQAAVWAIYGRVGFKDEVARLDPDVASFIGKPYSGASAEKRAEGFIEAALKVIKAGVYDEQSTNAKFRAISKEMGGGITADMARRRFVRRKVILAVQASHPEIIEWLGMKRFVCHYAGKESAETLTAQDIVNNMQALLGDRPSLWENRNDMAYGDRIEALAERLCVDQASLTELLGEPKILRRIGAIDAAVADFIGYPPDAELFTDDGLEEMEFLIRAREAKEKGITDYYAIMEFIGTGIHPFPAEYASEYYRANYDRLSTSRAGDYIGEPPAPEKS